jgi:hypothetical protein
LAREWTPCDLSDFAQFRTKMGVSFVSGLYMGKLRLGKVRKHTQGCLAWKWLSNLDPKSYPAKSLGSQTDRQVETGVV